jgi:RNA polymerase sigma factor (sigma-70 family)
MADDDDVSDGELLRMAYSGSTYAIYLLLKRYRGLIYATCFRHLRNHDDAREAFQETALSFVQWIARGPLTNYTSMPELFYQIAICRAVDLIRKRQRERRPIKKLMEQDPKETYANIPEWERQEIASIVSACLAKLSEHQRRLIFLRFFDELTWEEIAKQIERPSSTIRDEVAKILKLLKPCVEEKGLLWR